MLTQLQQRLLEIVSQLPEAERFALAGGAALILRGTVDRTTNDLDLFIGHDDVEADTIATMVAAVERALVAAGLRCRREVVSDTFARLTVETEGEECRIDLAVDVRIRPVDRDPRVALLSLDELAADKVLALFGRAAARDYQDVAALRRHFSWTVLLELASEKDAGFSVEGFLDAVAAFDRLDADDFDTSPDGYERLRTEVAGWASQIRSQG
ncbi:MAG: nucleotidyl transferase AbiEii/AbiGii toxin family protein [Nitriliruptoraceae bacterium]|nr:nucleotidyl transferase AbiEii/AbiGii toxin family protein [Nitriliruptoraceae bacterium]